MTTTSQGVSPTYDSEGHQVWKPSVGIVYKENYRDQHSYGGIVSALQDAIAAEGIQAKNYPHNFAGIIAAIQDLEAGQAAEPPVGIGPIPPGSIIDPDGNLIIIKPSREGDLWFDERQGRLFVYQENEWWQTNGADGLAYVSTAAAGPPTDIALPGQFWFDPEHKDLYIYTEGEWVLASDGDSVLGLQTTATLPLASTGPRINIGDHEGNIIPDIELTDFNTQLDYNQWSFLSLVALEAELESFDPVVIDINPPDEPRPGALWYDTESLELSIWYDDGDTAQWVPTSAAYTYDEDLATVSAAIEEETRVRERAIHQVYVALDGVNKDRLGIIEASISAVEAAVNAIEIPEYDFTPYAIKAELQPITEDIDALKLLTNEYAELEQTAYDTHSMVTSLNATVQTLSTKAELSAVQAQIPSLEAYPTTETVDQKIAAIANDYLPRTGGALSGSFTLNNSHADKPTFDFSQYISSGQNAFKFQTMSTQVGDYTTFGLTNKFWEYAWNFASDEDFCWIYNDTNKVFSITKDGPACSQLYIGDITGNTNNQRVIANKIDVRDRLTKYQYAFTTLRAKVHSASTFEELKAGILEALTEV